MNRPIKNKSGHDKDPKSPNPQFTESIAMIMEQFKNPPKESRLKKRLIKFSIYLTLTGVIGLLIYIGITSIESISLTNNGNSTQLIINYKP